MSKEDEATTKAREAEYGQGQINMNSIGVSQDELEQRALLAGLARAPTLPSPTSSRAPAPTQKQRSEKDKGKGKATGTPLDSRVRVKVEKLAAGLASMRKGLLHAMVQTSEDLVYLRRSVAHEQRHVQEAWVHHDLTDHQTFASGKTNQRTEYVCPVILPFV